jgi:ppGpp synthetase/RelA/SpoT-type nucleotidyltranferase
MPFTRPEFSKNAVNRAAEAIRNKTNSTEDEMIVENWRASHAFVLNTFQMNLRRRCAGGNITFAQRLKRRRTIFDKLMRQPDMQLARMHDIAGCRLIFESEEDLRTFRDSLLKSRMQHRRRVRTLTDGETVEPYEYIENPRETGYRGIHDVYAYDVRNTQGEAWNGLQIEIQFRTKFQHAWATAVEICDSLQRTRVKFAEASQNYMMLFKIASEVIARKWEQRVYFWPEKSLKELIEEMLQIESELHLFRALQAIGANREEFIFRKFAVLTFNEEIQQLEIHAFGSARDAIEFYFESEENSSEQQDIVLVRANSSDAMRYAFKNYFQDAVDFLNYLDNPLIDEGFRPLADTF